MSDVSLKTESLALKNKANNGKIGIHNDENIEEALEDINTPTWRWKALGFSSYEAFRGWCHFNRISNPNYSGDYHLHNESFQEHF